MAKFWCWLFGHKWFCISDWLLANTDIKYALTCSRCGKGTAKIIQEPRKKYNGTT